MRSKKKEGGLTVISPLDGIPISIRTKRSVSSMVYARLVPWYNSEELAQVKKWFYSDKDHDRRRAVFKVRSYESKGTQYVPHVIASTANITDAVLLDKAGNTDPSILQMTYTMALIRFVNGLLDPSQKSQYAIPLHTLAKNVGLTPWLVDLRHRSTHERDLYALGMLRIAAREALDWLWDHYWNDDTLDEDDDSGSDDGRYSSAYTEEDRKFYQVKSLLLLWPELIMTFKSNKEMWLLSRKTNIIRSTNFDIPGETPQRESKKESITKKRIQKYISQWKECWVKLGNDTDRDTFIKICMEHYNPLLFHVLLQSIRGNFGASFLKWLVKEYHAQINGSPEGRGKSRSLERFFSKWDDLEINLVKKQVKYLDISLIITHWSVLKETLGLYPSGFSVMVCRYLLEVAEPILKSKYNRGRNRGSTPSPIERVIRDLRDYISRLSGTYTPVERQIYESSFESDKLVNIRGKQAEGEVVEEEEENKRNKVPGEEGSSRLSTPDSILSDLASLKRRMNQLSEDEIPGGVSDSPSKRKKVLQATLSEGETRRDDEHVPLWAPIANWSPTPFGTLLRRDHDSI